jgi:hypothetical protein
MRVVPQLAARAEVRDRLDSMNTLAKRGSEAPGLSVRTGDVLGFYYGVFYYGVTAEGRAHR